MLHQTLHLRVNSDTQKIGPKCAHCVLYIMKIPPYCRSNSHLLSVQFPPTVCPIPPYCRSNSPLLSVQFPPTVGPIPPYCRSKHQFKCSDRWVIDTSCHRANLPSYWHPHVFGCLHNILKSLQAFLYTAVNVLPEMK